MYAEQAQAKIYEAMKMEAGIESDDDDGLDDVENRICSQEGMSGKAVPPSDAESRMVATVQEGEEEELSEENDSMKGSAAGGSDMGSSSGRKRTRRDDKGHRRPMVEKNVNDLKTTKVNCGNACKRVNLAYYSKICKIFKENRENMGEEAKNKLDSMVKASMIDQTKKESNQRRSNYCVVDAGRAGNSSKTKQTI
jgi:hypothetical protein